MRQNSLIIFLVVASGIAACDDAPAYTMTDEENKQAESMTGFWSSIQDDVGFSGKLNADGTAVIVCGDPLETIKGSWWIASSPQRLVLQRQDKTLVEYKIVQSGADLMKLQALVGGSVFSIQRAAVVRPR